VKTVRSNFTDALREIHRLYPKNKRAEMQARLIAELCSSELEPLADLLAQVSDPTARLFARKYVGEKWKDKDPEVLANYCVQRLKGPDRAQIFWHAMNGLLEKGDLSVTAKLVQQIPSSPTRSSWIGSLATQYSQRDLNAAFEWANALTPIGDRLSAYAEMIPSVGLSTGVDGLKQLLPQLPTARLQRICVDTAIERYANVNEALAWLDTLDDENRSAGECHLVRKKASEDFPYWTNFALQIPSAEARGSAISAIADQYVGREPVAAANWTLGLPEEVRNSALYTVIDRWYRNDSVKVSEWINGLPAGDTRDAALLLLINRLTSSQQDAAVQAANSIVDDKKREEALSLLKGRAARRVVH
jgi:hypothetical protein